MAATAAAPPVCVPCCVETGCVCLTPGLRCGFAWRQVSEYEKQRDASKRANEEMLRSLGLLPPLAAEVAATGTPASGTAALALLQRLA